MSTIEKILCDIAGRSEIHDINSFDVRTIKLAVEQFGKELLEAAANNAETIVISDFHIIVDKQSITDTLNEFL